MKSIKTANKHVNESVSGHYDSAMIDILDTDKSPQKVYH